MNIINKLRLWLLPGVRAWPALTLPHLRADALAGISGAIIVLPQGVAFATIAGLPPEYGLYAAMVPTAVAALFGSSWHLVSGPTTAISIVVFAALSPLATPGSPQYVQMALTLALLTGLFQLIMGLARLGALVNFISHSVVIGFTAGAAVLIAASQLKNFFGIPMERGIPFHEIIHHVALHLHHTNPWVLGVGVTTLLTGLLARRYWPQVPYMIVAMLMGSVLAYALNEGAGAAIPTVGALPGRLPPLSWPDLSWETLRTLLPSALAITMLALTEAVSIARAIAVKSGQRIEGNQEFIGQGLSNIAGAFFSGYPASGSFNRSGLNYSAGAVTPLASVFAAFSLAAIVLFVAPLAAYLPVPAMAGILFLVAWGLIDWHHIHTILHTSTSETAVLSVTFLATLFVELEFAIYIGVLLSLLLYLNRTSQPEVEAVVPDPEHPARKSVTTQGQWPECPQLKILRLHGSVFFGAVNHIQGELMQVDAVQPEQRHVLLLMQGVNFIDLAGAELLAQEAQRRRKLGGGLYLLGVKSRVLDYLSRGHYLDLIGPANLFQTKSQALAQLVPRLAGERCRTCQVRIFRECAAQPGAAQAAIQPAVPATCC